MNREVKAGGGDSRGRDHMANTRTLLAWIRTAVALIGLGFVVARFGLFLRALGARAGGGSGGSTASGVIGLTLVLLGVLITALSLRRFQQVERSVEAGVFKPDVTVEFVTAGAMIVAGMALAAYLLLTR